MTRHDLTGTNGVKRSVLIYSFHAVFNTRAVMNLDKARKRIEKHVKKGFRGYPLISLCYSGEAADCATRVAIQFVAEEGAEPQEQTFTSQTDVRKDEVIQTTLLKIIERAEAHTVTETEAVELI